MLDECPVGVPNQCERGGHARRAIDDFLLEIIAELRLRDQMYTDQ